MKFQLLRYGPIFTDFDTVWALRSTQQLIQDCLPREPCHLIYLDGFNVDMLILGPFIGNFYFLASYGVGTASFELGRTSGP